MEIKEAIQVLKDHNVWRRYDGEIGEEPKMTNPKRLGIAIDKVISEFENLFISGVSNCGGGIPYDSLSDSFKKSIDSIEDNLNK
tara:strand:+ start:60 stop:311 length:252 start_codon:yes stop_codon:yes gene_type:complete